MELQNLLVENEIISHFSHVFIGHLSDSHIDRIVYDGSFSIWIVIQRLWPSPDAGIKQSSSIA